MQGHGAEDEFEIENLTIELPADDDPARRQTMAQDVIQQLPGLLRENTEKFDEQ
jgi:hypothetical protein